MRECQSYQPREMVCRDGFVQRPYCHGRAGCTACGHIAADALPGCLRNEIPEHLATDRGAPLFYRSEP